MHSGISPTHLDQPLTADEAAALARLKQKVARANQFSRLGDRLTSFYRRRYPRWLALNPLLPRCYFGNWSIPVARWPWSARAYPVSLPHLYLTLLESDTLDYLDARRRRPAELAKLDYHPHAANGWINRYERRKSETLPEQQAEQAQAVLADFEARLPERRAHLEQSYADDYHAYQRAVMGFDKRAAYFRQHMAAELALLAPPAATTGTTGADRWAGLLTDFMLADLTALLVFVGLLETAEPLAVAQGTKPGQWVAVAAALYKSKRTRADKAALHRAFSDTYGPAVGSLSSFSREYNEGNEAASQCYSRALSRLG